MSDQEPGEMTDVHSAELAERALESSSADHPNALAAGSVETPPSSGLFGNYLVSTPETRMPNFGDLLVFSVMLFMGFLAMIASAGLVAHYHWFGVVSAALMQNNTRIALGTEGILYGVTLAFALPIFQLTWQKGFFAGVHWHAETAARLSLRLTGVAVFCNVVAMVGNAILPFPQHAPIDKMFSTTADAYLIMVFGVTVAPFFEELIFRGFLLPAFATAWDWGSERISHRQPPPLDNDGNPVWSAGAQIFSALVVSAPFALMHAEQVGNSWGPVVLLYCVSLILCAVRLRTRSLASSTLVHAMYNFMLFAVMFYETDAFRHLDKM